MVFDRLWESNGWGIDAGSLALGQPDNSFYTARIVPTLRFLNADLSGHGLPPVYSGPVLELISSTVNLSSTMAEVRCSNCTKWSGGSIDLESTSANFIYAYGETAPEDPGNPNSDFFIHVDSGNFNLDLQNARVSPNTTPPPVPRVTATVTASIRPKVDLSMLH